MLDPSIILITFIGVFIIAFMKGGFGGSLPLGKDADDVSIETIVTEGWS